MTQHTSVTYAIWCEYFTFRTSYSTWSWHIHIFSKFETFSHGHLSSEVQTIAYFCQQSQMSNISESCIDQFWFFSNTFNILTEDWRINISDLIAAILESNSSITSVTGLPITGICQGECVERKYWNFHLLLKIQHDWANCRILLAWATWHK